MDEIKQKVIALLPPVIETRVTGEALVSQLFEIQLKRKETLKVAGCKVIDGLVEKSKEVTVVRNGKPVFESTCIHFEMSAYLTKFAEGTIHTLRHLKDDVQEIRKGIDCGISIGEFSDLQVGDTIKCIQIIEKPGIL